MSDARMTKKKLTPKPLGARAWLYATKNKERKAAKSWSDEERGTYWWGLYEGYIAGVRAERKRK